MPENLVLNLPYGNIFANLIIIILGFAALYYWFDKDRTKRRKDENDAEDRLIGLLKETTEEFEKKIKAQTTKIETLETKVTKLETENKTLLDILQGRDKRTVEFYDKSFESMQVTAKTHQIVEALATNVTETNKKIQDLVEGLSNADIIKRKLIKA